MKRLAAALALLTCLGVTARATSRAPNLTDRAERWRQVDTYEIDPPLIYYRWWLETKECLGVEEPPVPFEEIRFMIRVDLILYGRTLGVGGHPDPPFGTCVVAPGSNEHTWEPPRL